MKKRKDILQPIEVSGIYPVLKNTHTLKGFRVTVTYNGNANVKSGADVLPVKCGCKFGKAQFENGKTKIDYVFHDGLFLSDAMGRAVDFKKDVQEIINLRPVYVSAVKRLFFSMHGGWMFEQPDDESMCVGYRVVVRYPGNMVANNLFKYVIPSPDSRVVGVKYDAKANLTDVEYHIDNKNNSDSYHRASMFQSVMYRKIKSTKDENIK